MKKLLPLFLLIVLLSVGSAHAQAPLSFTEVRVDLWPEYDQPSMLVIYRMQLAADAPLSSPIAFRVPAAAGEPTAVAAGQVGGDLFNTPYQTSRDGDWTLITLTPTMPVIQLEYYAPLTIDGATRTYQYDWLGEYAIQRLVIQVKQPVDATNLLVEPAVGEMRRDQTDGLAFYFLEVGSTNAGDTVTVKISYQKETDTLSSENFPVQPSVPMESAQPDSLIFMDILPWLLGGLGVLLLVGGLLWYWRSGSERPAGAPAAQRGARKPESAASPQRVADSRPGAVYCHQCGNRAEASDRFCRSCGTKLRVE